MTPSLRVDAHLHVWRAALGEITGPRTPPLPTLVPPQNDVPIDLARETLLDNHVDRAVLVQPVFRGEDNSYVADCARAEPSRFAAVCVVDPRVAGAEDRLAHWSAQGCRGLRLRPRIAAEQTCFGDPSTFPLWQTAERLGLVVSLLAGCEHVPALARLAERFPTVPIVIDHLAQPDVSMGVAAATFQSLLQLARYPRVMVKLSGYYHFSRQRFPFADCGDMIRALYDHFGPDRLLWGSDFPHVLLACGYARATQLPWCALSSVPAPDRDLVMGLNTLRLYWPD